jgi:hypothetical protein
MVLVAAACADYEGLSIQPYDPESPSTSFCDIDEAEIFQGGPKDLFTALSNPKVVPATHPEAGYLQDDDLVVGIRVGADVLAFPLRIFWYHEIVNFELFERAFAVTHCPLTGSSLAFDRGPVDDSEFGVSGLLYRTNLIMYDRPADVPSFWPQMSRGARCGPRVGTALTMVPVMEMTWQAWREMHPQTWVVSEETGFDRSYDVYPYGEYRDLDNFEVLFPLDIDWRRPIKERVLGVADESGGVGYPFGELESLGPIGVVEHSGDTSAPGGTVVFWDTRAETAMAFSREVDSVELTFTVVGDAVVDQETGSAWRVDGVATSGPLAGRQLDPVVDAYVAYWFAWAAFEPEAELWEAP